MKSCKNVIAVAVAASLAAPVIAQAEAEVYGNVRVSAGVVSDDNPGATAEDSKFSVTSHASRLGFKGSDDLGDGLIAIWQIESQVDFDDSSGGLFDGMRNTFVGLKGGFGKVIAGRHDTPYKLAAKDADIFVDLHADYTGAVLSKTHDTRFDNLVAYFSPTWSGLNFIVGVSGDTANDDLPDAANTDKKDAASGEVTYEIGPVSASIAAQTISNGTGNPDKKAAKAGVIYKLDNASRFAFVYENAEEGAALDQNALYLSAAHDFGGMTLKGALGQKGETASGANDGSDFAALGLFKTMSKTTELYALYTQTANDTAGTNGLAEVSPGFADKTTSALVVGINLTFSSK
ncbi:MAG: outer membrane protein (porin) [Gammaproteobacteria bacterium]|nr:MAG: outer membrane protein (porin) [Gammaproteobacteria bacterium]TND06620.1 MAG: outer membrane protein (porin) [Gammaproteobacteria bacterium]